MTDKILITEEALAETIRCAICKNPNKTERGCDGSCQYDKELHEKIVEAVTGIAEQRPHGTWIDTDVTYEDTGDVERRCSNCKHGDRQSPSAIVPYCWYCGADMREGGDS